MMTPQIIETLIQAQLPCTHLAVDGDGYHFEAVIVSAEFAGKSRIQRQQRVLQTLRAQLDSGELHALSMKTLTPDEWAVQNG